MKIIRTIGILLFFVFAVALQAGQNADSATFTLYYSNDMLGYLTPCG
jgi:hypothetical protein